MSTTRAQAAVILKYDFPLLYLSGEINTHDVKTRTWNIVRNSQSSRKEGTNDPKKL